MPDSTALKVYLDQARTLGCSYLTGYVIVASYIALWASIWSPMTIKAYYSRRNERGYSGGEGYVVGAVVGWVIAAFLFLFSLFTLDYAWTLLFNPMYWVMQKLAGKPL